MLGLGSKFLTTLSEDELKDLKIDHVFALFLIDVSERSIVNFYKTMVIFIDFFRECINVEGWNFISKYKIVFDEETKKEMRTYTSIKSAETVPHFTNEFLMRFLP